MAWKCGECHVAEDDRNRVDVVCHHYGKPLCERDRISLVDDAFSRDDRAAPQEAFHCAECARRDHPTPTLRVPYRRRVERR